MTLPKALLPLVAASACLGGCVYEEIDTGYQEPRRVYHGGYVERRPVYYEENRPRGYYRERPVTVYEERPRAYYGQPTVYGGGYAVVHQHRGESLEEAKRRQLREYQRAQEEHHDKKKDDDKKKKKKKKDHDD